MDFTAYNYASYWFKKVNLGKSKELLINYSFLFLLVVVAVGKSWDYDSVEDIKPYLDI